MHSLRRHIFVCLIKKRNFFNLPKILGYLANVCKNIYQENYKWRKIGSHIYSIAFIYFYYYYCFSYQAIRPFQLSLNERMNVLPHKNHLFRTYICVRHSRNETIKHFVVLCVFHSFCTHSISKLFENSLNKHSPEFRLPIFIEYG